MQNQSLSAWEETFRHYILNLSPGDSAHDISHIERVVKNAKKLAQAEKASLDIVVPAAWLHDCISVAKDSPLRNKASAMAAQHAREKLNAWQYTQTLLDAICHAIEAHSFSAKIQAQSIEAKVVQDADRLDALGAIGLVRCIATGAILNRPLYSETDPFCEMREPDDSKYTLDHFYAKLLRLPQLMQTDAGRKEAQSRAEFLELFLDRLKFEVSEKPG